MKREKPELEIIEINKEDIITSSGDTPQDHTGPGGLPIFGKSK